MPARKSAKAAAAAIASTYGVSTFPTKMPPSHSTCNNEKQMQIVRAHQLAKLNSLKALRRPHPYLDGSPPPSKEECGLSIQGGIYMVDMTQLRGLYFRSRRENIEDPPEPTRIVGGIVLDTRTNPLYYQDIWDNMVPEYTKRGEIFTVEPYVGQYFTLVLATTLRAVPMVVTSAHDVESKTGTFGAREVDIFNGKPITEDENGTIVFRLIRRHKTTERPGYFEWISDNADAKGTVYWNAFVEWDWM
jgi:hypothetical protein